MKNYVEVVQVDPVLLFAHVLVKLLTLILLLGLLLEVLRVLPFVVGHFSFLEDVLDDPVGELFGVDPLAFFSLELLLGYL